MHKVYGPLGWDVNLLGSLDFNDNTPILQPVPLHKSKMATSQDDRNDNDVDSIATTEDDFSNSILDDSFLDDNTNLILIPDEKDDDDAVDNNDGNDDEEQDKENDGCQGDDGDGCYGDDGMNSSTTAVKEESTTSNISSMSSMSDIVPSSRASSDTGNSSLDHAQAHRLTPPQQPADDEEYSYSANSSVDQVLEHSLTPKQEDILSGQLADTFENESHSLSLSLRSSETFGSDNDDSGDPEGSHDDGRDHDELEASSQDRTPAYYSVTSKTEDSLTSSDQISSSLGHSPGYYSVTSKPESTLSSEQFSSSLDHTQGRYSFTSKAEDSSSNGVYDSSLNGQVCYDDTSKTEDSLSNDLYDSSNAQVCYDDTSKTEDSLSNGLDDLSMDQIDGEDSLASKQDDSLSISSGPGSSSSFGLKLRGSITFAQGDSIEPDFFYDDEFSVPFDSNLSDLDMDLVQAEHLESLLTFSKAMPNVDTGDSNLHMVPSNSDSCLYKYNLDFSMSEQTSSHGESMSDHEVYSASETSEFRNEQMFSPLIDSSELSDFRSETLFTPPNVGLEICSVSSLHLSPEESDLNQSYTKDPNIDYDCVPRKENYKLSFESPTKNSDESMMNTDGETFDFADVSWQRTTQLHSGLGNQQTTWAALGSKESSPNQETLPRLRMWSDVSPTNSEEERCRKLTTWLVRQQQYMQESTSSGESHMTSWAKHKEHTSKRPMITWEKLKELNDRKQMPITTWRQVKQARRQARLEAENKQHSRSNSLPNLKKRRSQEREMSPGLMDSSRARDTGAAAPQRPHELFSKQRRDKQEKEEEVQMKRRSTTLFEIFQRMRGDEMDSDFEITSPRSPLSLPNQSIYWRSKSSPGNTSESDESEHSWEVKGHNKKIKVHPDSSFQFDGGSHTSLGALSSSAGPMFAEKSAEQTSVSPHTCHRVKQATLPVRSQQDEGINTSTSHSSSYDSGLLYQDLKAMLGITTRNFAVQFPPRLADRSVQTSFCFYPQTYGKENKSLQTSLEGSVHLKKQQTAPHGKGGKKELAASQRSHRPSHFYQQVPPPKPLDSPTGILGSPQKRMERLSRSVYYNQGSLPDLSFLNQHRPMSQSQPLTKSKPRVKTKSAYLKPKASSTPVFVTPKLRASEHNAVMKEQRGRIPGVHLLNSRVLTEKLSLLEKEKRRQRPKSWPSEPEKAEKGDEGEEDDDEKSVAISHGVLGTVIIAESRDDQSVSTSSFFSDSSGIEAGSFDSQNRSGQSSVLTYHSSISDDRFSRGFSPSSQSSGFSGSPPQHGSQVLKSKIPRIFNAHVRTADSRSMNSRCKKNSKSLDHLDKSGKEEVIVNQVSGRSPRPQSWSGFNGTKFPACNACLSKRIIKQKRTWQENMQNPDQNWLDAATDECPMLKWSGSPIESPPEKEVSQSDMKVENRKQRRKSSKERPVSYPQCGYDISESEYQEQYFEIDLRGRSYSDPIQLAEIKCFSDMSPERRRIELIETNPQKPLKSCLVRKKFHDRSFRKRSLSDPYDRTVRKEVKKKEETVVKETPSNCQCVDEGEVDDKVEEQIVVPPPRVSSSLMGRHRLSWQETSMERSMEQQHLTCMQRSYPGGTSHGNHQTQLSPQSKLSVPPNSPASNPTSPCSCQVTMPALHRTSGVLDLTSEEDLTASEYRSKKSVSFAEEVSYSSPLVSPHQSPKKLAKSGLCCQGQQDKLKVIVPRTQGPAGIPVSSLITSGDSDHSTTGNSPPPSEFTLSPPPSMFSSHDSHDSSSSNEVHQKRALVLEVVRAAEAILGHFGDIQDPFEKARLGNSIQCPAVGYLIHQQLCPAVHSLITDGLKPYTHSLFGKVRNCEWRLLEDSTNNIGPSSRAVRELVRHLRSQGYLTNSQMRFNAFIFGLLNIRALDFWLNSLYTQQKVLHKHYEVNGLLCLTSNIMRQIFIDMISAIHPLAAIPFKLDYAFEWRNIHRVENSCSELQNVSSDWQGEGGECMAQPLEEVDTSLGSDGLINEVFSNAGSSGSSENLGDRVESGEFTASDFSFRIPTKVQPPKSKIMGTLQSLDSMIPLHSLLPGFLLGGSTAPAAHDSLESSAQSQSDAQNGAVENLKVVPHSVFSESAKSATIILDHAQKFVQGKESMGVLLNHVYSLLQDNKVHVTMATQKQIEKIIRDGEIISPDYANEESVTEEGFLQKIAKQISDLVTMETISYKRGVTDYEFDLEMESVDNSTRCFAGHSGKDVVHSPLINLDLTPDEDEDSVDYSAECTAEAPNAYLKSRPKVLPPSEKRQNLTYNSTQKDASTQDTVRHTALPGKMAVAPYNDSAVQPKTVMAAVTSVAKTGVKKWGYSFGTSLISAFDKLLLAEQSPPAKPLLLLPPGGETGQLSSQPSMQSEERQVSSPASQHVARVEERKSASRKVAETEGRKRRNRKVRREEQGRYVMTLCHHIASDENQLSFEKGVVMETVETKDIDWLMCYQGDRSGLVHAVCVRDLTQSELFRYHHRDL